MLKVFGRTDTLFSSNGDIVLKPIRAIVHKAGNAGEVGDYYIEVVTDLSYIDYLVSGNIIVATTPTGQQGFRIGTVTKTKNKLNVKAWHLFYDAENYLIADSYVQDKNCDDALDHLNNATEPVSEFTTISDIGDTNSYRCVRTSLAEAVKNVLGRWGGYLTRDNFTIGIYRSIGVDNGVTVRYGKNIKDITCEENWDDVVTKLLPVGKDGILLNAVDSSASLYVTSSTQYDIPYTKSISFTQEVNEEDYQDDEGNLDEAAYTQALVDDLRQQAQAYVDAYCVPRVNYTLSANLEKITDIGDTVEVIDERLGINITTNVISYDWDVIAERYITVEFGNFKPTLGHLISSMTATASKIAEEKSEVVRFTLTEELQTATDKIMAVMGNSYVIYDGDKILVVDELPKELAHNVIRINSAGIGFSTTGITGTFTSAWTIDGTLNMQAINVINLTASMIKGGTLKLGSNLNESGILELYDSNNSLIGKMDADGLKMYGQDGSYVLMNDTEGFAGYDAQGNKIYWAASDQFHMKKAVVEDEITLCGKLRFIPITITVNGTVTNDGIGLVSTE